MSAIPDVLFDHIVLRVLADDQECDGWRWLSDKSVRDVFFKF